MTPGTAEKHGGWVLVGEQAQQRPTVMFLHHTPG